MSTCVKDMPRMHLFGAWGGSRRIMRYGAMSNDVANPIDEYGIRDQGLVVPGAGIEPTRPCGQGILSPLCLPFHHPGKVVFEPLPALAGLEPVFSFSGSSIIISVLNVYYFQWASVARASDLAGHMQSHTLANIACRSFVHVISFFSQKDISTGLWFQVFEIHNPWNPLQGDFSAGGGSAFGRKSPVSAISPPRRSQ